MFGLFKQDQRADASSLLEIQMENQDRLALLYSDMLSGVPDLGHFINTANKITSSMEKETEITFCGLTVKKDANGACKWETDQLSFKQFLDNVTTK